MCAAAQTYQFSSNTKRILDIFCNSVYKNNDTFLRELISNSSDALDKIRFQSLTDPSKLSTGDVLQIEIYLDKAESTFTIKDTGIGMTKIEMIKNLGTIAHTGTRAFLEAHAQDGDLTMIGQFGVGFYSVFLVSESVKVISKSNDDEWFVWESTGDGTFTVSECEPYPGLERGTVIIAYLKGDKTEYLQEKKVREIVKKHSEFIPYPIKLQVEKEEEVEMTDDEEDTAEQTGEPKIEELDAEEIANAEAGAEKKKKKVKQRYQTLEKLNTTRPLWAMNSAEITQTQYGEFYKSLSNDWEEHLAVKDFQTEGQLEYRAILFVPQRAPFDLFETKKNKSRVKLYVRRVLVSGECEDLLPEWLGFLVVAVNSSDLPMNISRETLQKSSVLKLIKKGIVRKMIEMFEEMKLEKRETYLKFWAQFSRSLKLGVHEDSQNKEALSGLMLFYTTKSGSEMTDFEGYISRMKEGQTEIYFICGQSRETVEQSSVIEWLVKAGYEVCLFVDTIDEYAVQKVAEFKGKKLVDVTKDGFTLPISEEAKKKMEEKKAEFQGLCDLFKQHLGNQVEGVSISNRLTVSPCAIVTGQYGWSANMERIMKNQALRDTSTMGYMSSKKKLELNAEHPIVVSMLKDFVANGESASLIKCMDMLFDCACAKAGIEFRDPDKFASTFFELIGFALGAETPVAEVDAAAPVAADVEEPSQLEEVD